MAGLLQGKRALITGAGRGIGVAIADELAKEGATLALNYRHTRPENGDAFCVQGDLTDPAQAVRVVEEAVTTLGGLDIIIANAAGFGPLQPLARSNFAYLTTEWHAVVAPVVNVVHAAIPYLKNGEAPSIVTLTATLLHRPAMGQGAHAMAKAAVLAYTRTLAKELGPEGIRVNAVAPGMALTEFSQNLPEEKRETVRTRTPLRRLAQPEDVARLCVLLCTPLADILTGAELAADGGLSLPL